MSRTEKAEPLDNVRTALQDTSESAGGSSPTRSPSEQGNARDQPRRVLYTSAIFVGAIAVVAGASFAVLRNVPRAAIAVRESPGLVVDPPTVAVSASFAGQKTEVEVGLVNRTDQPLRIVGAGSSCVCVTPARSFPMVIGPRERGTVKCRVDLGKQAEPGEFLAHVRFFMESSSQPPSVDFTVGP
jgi:hypothetical protein